MKKLIAVGLALILALSVGAGTVLADEGNGCGNRGGKPSIDVEKEIEICGDWMYSYIWIKNTSEVYVTITSLTDTLYWQVGGGNWIPTSTPYVNSGIVIAPGAEKTYTIPIYLGCIPYEARELRNKVEVEIEGRNKIFRDIVSIEIVEDPD